jgi:DNA-binding NarL/FixJ family response regulator
MSDSSDEESRDTAKDLNSLEVRVLVELARGTTDTEVALKLFVYDDVVRTFYRSAIKKIGVRDHAQAMAWVRQHLALTPGAAHASR